MHDRLNIDPFSIHFKKTTCKSHLGDDHPGDHHHHHHQDQMIFVFFPRKNLESFVIEEKKEGEEKKTYDFTFFSSGTIYQPTNQPTNNKVYNIFSK